MNYTYMIYFLIDIIITIIIALCLSYLVILNAKKKRIKTKSYSGYFAYLNKIQANKKSKKLKNSTSTVFSVFFLIILISITVLNDIPKYKDIPDLFKGNYQFTEGTVKYIQYSKANRSIHLTEEVLYVPDLWQSDLTQGEKYKLAYLKNSRYCIGYKLINRNEIK